MALTEAGQMQKARMILGRLNEAIAAWREVEQIRRQLPAHLRPQLPASREQALLAIVTGLRRRGAVQAEASSVQGYGGVFIPLVVLAGVGIAGAAVIIAAWPAIQREHRASMDARNKARQLQSIAAAESREAAQLGPAEARRRAQQRTAEVVQLYEAGPPAAELAFGPGAGPAGPPGAGAIYKALAPYAVPLLIIGGIIIAVKLRR